MIMEAERQDVEEEEDTHGGGGKEGGKISTEEIL